MFTTAPHHIIAIGASAGSMEELNSLFDHTPIDGVAYVIVQHLSPDYKSRMVELVARHSILVVKEAENEMLVKSNHVYLIPPDKFMTIQGGRFYLTDKDHRQDSRPHLTINTFFESLAKDYGSKAIGVLLSGLGKDGTEGITAIKKAGGLVVVRNPETTEYGSMPSNALATGLVDFVVEPELLPAAINDYIKQGEALLSDNLNDESNIHSIIDLIKEQLPLDFSDYKQTTILRRIKRRAAYHNSISLANYLNLLKQNSEEIKALAQDFLISVTSFFRDKEAFDFIQTNIIPQLLQRILPGEELKMWVTGCATGEEAYSLAILICEQLKEDQKDITVKIFATDIDNLALEHARRGSYNLSNTKEVSADRLEKCFINEGTTYRVKPEIRQMVIFAQHDLVKHPPYCNMDFISCRNLLIYMT
ncbi:MAG: chemotaxis protein CheR, partial [Bacteroidota bacterium]|nr:chemotaxis protein CheR [Bacteroidota bacterium]